MRKTKGRLVGVLLAGLFTVTMFGAASCKPKPVEFDFSPESIRAKYDAALYKYDGGDVNLTMSHWDAGGAAIERAVLDVVLESFHIRYPKISVKLDIVPNYEESYAANIATDNIHDVFMVGDGNMPLWADGGRMLNLDPYIQASELIVQDEMFATALDRYRYNPQTGLTGSGNILALPKDIGPIVMFYNQDIFDEMGVEYPPDDRILTIDEATVMWKKLNRVKNGEITRYAMAGLSIEGLVWSAGGDFLNENKSAFPTKESDVAALKKAYQYMQDAYLTHEVMPPAEYVASANVATLFSMERVACIMSGRWEVSSFRNLPFRWNVAYIPAFKGLDGTDAEAQTHNSYSGSVGYAVNNRLAGDKKTAAVKLVEYIASKEGQELLTATGFQIPIYEALGMDEDLVAAESTLGPQNYEVFIQSAKHQPTGLWQYKKSTRWMEIGYHATSEKLYDPVNTMSVDEFIAKARTAVNQNI